MYVLSTKCQKGCPGRLEKFDAEQSSTFEDFRAQRQEQAYGQGFVKGGMGKDQVCWSNDQENCQYFKFLSVDGGNELQKDQFSGIIGLAPPSSEEKSTVPAFVQQMNQIFSFYLSKGSGSEGNLKFGGYNIEKYAKPGKTEADIIWTNLVDDGWTIPMNALKFQDTNETVEIKASQLTLDTGLSYALVPPNDIENIMGAMKKNQNITCKKEGYYDLDMYSCACKPEQHKSLKPLMLNINGHDFKLPVDAWMSYDANNKNKECKILMHPYDISMTATYKWVVGIQFLQNFYSIYDIGNKRVGLIEAKEE